MSLYTRYRPRDWDSVIGQDYITRILRNSLRSGRTSHAYLFHGSRGTGKTTSARILAKAVNCTSLRDGNPCHECANCQAFDSGTMLDVIEIDAASNTGVDNIRELIERARFEPNQGQYKVYIIDEVHMLSTGAFNALLKTLEEPPVHVKFILATTEIEKVPETIRSRTLRFDFRKIGLEDIITRLEYVCQTEHIKAEKEALGIIAKSARGGLRDALTLLEQNVIDSEVSTEHVRYTLSLVEDTLIDACINSLVSLDIPTTQSIIETLRERHVQVRSFFDQMMYRLRDLMVAHIDDTSFSTYSELMDFFEGAYGRIRTIPDGMLLIELTLLRIAKRGDTEVEITYTPPAKKAPLAEVTSPKKEEKKEEPRKTETIPKTEVSKTEGETPPLESSIGNRETRSFSFPSLIAEIKNNQPALALDLKTARFGIEGSTLTLTFSKKWNYDRVNVPKVKNIIAEVATSLFDGDWRIECMLQEGVGSAYIADGVF